MPYCAIQVHAPPRGCPRGRAAARGSNRIALISAMAYSALRRLSCHQVEVGRVVGEVEAHAVRAGGKPNVGRVDQPVGDQLHDPGQRAAQLDRVEAHRVGVVVDALGGALVEDADLRAEGVIRLVVLLEVLDDTSCRRPAHGSPQCCLVLGLDRLLVELGQVVLQDEVVVLAQTCLFGGVDALVVEAHDALVERAHVHAEGAARLELRRVAVLGRHGEIGLDRLLAEVFHEIAVDLLRVAQIGVFPLAAERRCRRCCGIAAAGCRVRRARPIPRPGRSAPCASGWSRSRLRRCSCAAGPTASMRTWSSGYSAA